MGGDLGASQSLVGELVGDVTVDHVLAGPPAVVVGVAARGREVPPPVLVVPGSARAAALVPLLDHSEGGLHTAVLLHVVIGVPDGVRHELVRVGGVREHKRDDGSDDEEHESDGLEGDVHEDDASALLLRADEAAARDEQHEDAREEEYPRHRLGPVHFVVQEVVVLVAEAGDILQLDEEPDRGGCERQTEHYV